MPAGRPKTVAAPPRPLAPCDPATIAPLNSSGKPDLLNYMPSRLIPLDEAKQRGWSFFYEATACRYGHQAPRYVSNPRQCVDCSRIAQGKQPLSGAPISGTPEYNPKKIRPYTERKKEEPGTAAVVAPAPREPDRLEKRFLEEYAQYRELTTAAKAAGSTEAQILARMSWSAVFKDAVNQLEARLGIRQTPPAPLEYEWDDEKRRRLIIVYIDTGDVATARDAICVTPSQFFRELEENTAFATAFDEATPLAIKALEERATQLALAGNDKLLQKMLSAQLPEKYSERVKVDMKVTEKLTREQLILQFGQLIRKGRIIDAAFSELESAGSIEGPGSSEGTGSARESESYSDIL